MNYYQLKTIKIYSAAVFLVVLISFQVVFPLGIYAQQEDRNATVITELTGNGDKQLESSDATASKSLVSEELPPISESSAIKEGVGDQGSGINENIKLAETVPQVATKFKSVAVEKSGGGLAVTIESDGMIKDYNSFTLKRNLSPKLPARIVFDILNMKSSFRKEQTIPVNTKWVSRIRHYASPDKLRVVLDTKNEYLNDFSAKSVSNGLLISIGTSELKKADVYSKSDNQIQPAERLVAAKKNEKPEVSSDLKPVSDVSKKKQEKNLRPAWVDKIDFSSEEGGKSTITIGTTKPVEYSIKKASDRLLHLQLNNTNISTKQKRPLITTRFKSAVDGIWPVQTSEKTSLIAIELREAVAYALEQSDNLIKVHFEASSVSPKPEKDTNIPVWKEVLEAAPMEIDTVKPETKTPFTGQVADASKDLSEPIHKYTGEKIALDFFDTDIKNVFRILREVSGKNFAIDKSVTGKVTLSLEKPVPWDQVLDLVLKMNQLGMVYEGDIVRIAPIEAIKKEEELKQARILADQKSKEQQKAMGELVVEYIPVNYANAKSDILPQIEKIKTKDRGNISVDERTNLIIIMDVAEVIRRAKEIVKELDKVTPQVIIEARIVEASANFSREIGTSWGSGIGVQPTSLIAGTYGTVTSIDDRVGVGPQRGFDNLGGTYGVNTAINFPTSSDKASIGFNFVKIAGTPLLLNAKLQAMEAQGDGKIISAPKIVTLDNKEATIKQGLRYPYNKLDTSGNTTTVFEDVDLELKVKPHVTPDNRISMVIKIKKRDLGNIISGQQSFTTKEAETELLINDGETVVIGGIIKTTKSSGGEGVPGLSMIPILGWLFKTDSKTDNKEELLIFITPQIVLLEQRSPS